MLYCPSRRPMSFSKRLPGGRRRSCNDPAAWRMASFFHAAPDCGWQAAAPLRGRWSRLVSLGHSGLRSPARSPESPACQARATGRSTAWHRPPRSLRHQGGCQNAAKPRLERPVARQLLRLVRPRRDLPRQSTMPGFGLRSWPRSVPLFSGDANSQRADSCRACYLRLFAPAAHEMKAVPRY